jgi:hypothetical protein
MPKNLTVSQNFEDVKKKVARLMDQISTFNTVRLEIQ